MAKSIVQRDTEVCYVCGTNQNIHEHHVFFGTANRKQSEKYGMKVYLCQEHHTGSKGVHHNRTMDLFLKQTAQGVFEERVGSREEFMQIFGKNYL